jgi:DNA-binding response OmpR family regulator
MKKLTLDHSACSAYWGGQDLGITTGEYRILTKLASKPGSYFSYRDIYDSLRGTPGFFAGDGERGVNSNVRSAIKRIRRKLVALDPTLTKHNVIINYLAFGYCLQRDAIDTANCCPSCGQIVIIMRETVVVAPTPEPIPQCMPDYKGEVAR